MRTSFSTLSGKGTVTLHVFGLHLTRRKPPSDDRVPYRPLPRTIRGVSLLLRMKRSRHEPDDFGLFLIFSVKITDKRERTLSPVIGSGANDHEKVGERADSAMKRRTI